MVEADVAEKKTEFLTVDEGRKVVERLGPWTEDAEIHKLRFVPIPDIQGTTLGLQRVVKVADTEQEVTLPIHDRSGVKLLTGIPAGSLKEFEDDEDLFNRMIQHCLLKRTGHLVRLSGYESGVSSFRPPKGEALSPVQIYNAITEEIKGEVERPTFDRKGLSVRFIGEHAVEPAQRPGDVIRSGLVMRLNGHLELGAYSLRLICSNGMRRMHEIMYMTEPGQVLQTKVRDIIQTQHAAARQLTDNLVELDNHAAEGNREQLLIRLARRHQLPSHFVNKALQRLPELSSDATQFDFVNILTSIARDLPQPATVQMSLGRLTNEVAHDHSAHCSHCGSQLTETETN